MISLARKRFAARPLRWLALLACGLYPVPEARAQKGHGGHASPPHSSAPHMNFSAPRPPKMPTMNYSATSRMNRVSSSNAANVRSSKSANVSSAATSSARTSAKPTSLTRNASTANGVATGSTKGVATVAGATTGTTTGATTRTPGRSRRYWGNNTASRYRTYRTSSSQTHRFNQMVISRLRSAHSNMARVNHDYQGHRVRAMHHVSMAIRQLSHRSMMYQGVGYSPRMNAQGQGLGQGQGQALARRTGAGAGLNTGVRNAGMMRMSQRSQTLACVIAST